MFIRASEQIINKALNIVLNYDPVKVVFLNVLGGITKADDVARGVINVLNEVEREVPIVIRLTGTNEEEGHKLLEEFGNIRNGFKMVKIDDIKDAMYKAGFDFVEEDSSDEKLVFVGEYIDTQYEITLYAEDHVSGKFKIKNFNEIEL